MRWIDMDNFRYPLYIHKFSLSFAHTHALYVVILLPIPRPLLLLGKRCESIFWCSNYLWFWFSDILPTYLLQEMAVNGN